MPTLSDALRDELAAIAPASECDRLAELSGLFHVAGRAHLRGRGSVDVHLDVASSTVAVAIDTGLGLVLNPAISAGVDTTAGSFCARSRLSIFVPCHRVVSAGGLGSYGSYGTGYKRRLLALEGYADAL